MSYPDDRVDIDPYATNGAKNPRPSVSVVMPTLDEARNLPHVIPRLPAWIDELIVVDGYSTDDTVAVAQELFPDVRVIYQSGQGKGDALRCGIEAARADIVVTLDADGSTAPEEIPRFVHALAQGADLAKGSRYLQGGGSDDLTLLRSTGNKGLTLLVNVLFGTRYSDLCYGYNALWRRRAAVIDIDVDGFEIETLLALRAARARLRVVEVPSWEARRIHGGSNLNAVRDGWRILKLIVRERMPHRSPSSLSGDHRGLKRLRALEVGVTAETLRALLPHKIATNLAASAVVVAGATALPLLDEPGRFQAPERPPAGLVQAGGGAEDFVVAPSAARTPNVPTTSPVLSSATAAPGGAWPSVASGLAVDGEAPAAGVAEQPVIEKPDEGHLSTGLHDDPDDGDNSEQGASSAPHADEAAPGSGHPPPPQGGSQPAQTGAASGGDGAQPGAVGSPPGQSGDAPPGLGDTPPGQGETPPGQSDAAPDQGGTPPGQGEYASRPRQCCARSGRYATRPRQCCARPGRHAARSGRDAARSGRYATRPRQCCARPGRHAARSGRDAARSGRYATRPKRCCARSGRHAARSGRDATRPQQCCARSGRHAARSGRDATRPQQCCARSGRHAARSGRDATRPQQCCARPGRHAARSGRDATRPKQCCARSGRTPPGQSKAAPGQGGTPPGQGGTPQGADGAAPIEAEG